MELDEGNREQATAAAWMPREIAPYCLVPTPYSLLLRNVFGVEDRGYGLFLRDAVDLAEQVFDHVFQLALVFNYRGHALQVVVVQRALHQRDGMALRHVIEAETLGRLGLDADLVDFDSQEVGDSPAHLAGDGRDFGAARIRVVSMFTIWYPAC